MKSLMFLMIFWAGLSQGIAGDGIFSLKGVQLSGGFTYSNAASETEGLDDLKYSSGLKIGVEKTLPYGILAGLSYTQRGFAQSEEDSLGGLSRMRDSKIKLNYLSIHIAKGLQVKDFNLFAGIELDYFLGGKLQENLSVTYEGNTESGSLTSSIDTDDFGPIIFSIPMKFLDFGLLFGTSYHLSEQTTLVTSYYYGIPEWRYYLRHFEGGSLVEGKNRSLQVALSYSLEAGLSQWIAKNDIFSLEGLRLLGGFAYSKDFVGSVPELKIGVEKTVPGGILGGLSYTQRGLANLEEDNSDGYTRLRDSKFKLNYLSFHIAKNLSIRKFNLFAGFELGYLLGGKVQEDLTGTFEGNTFAFSDPSTSLDKDNWKENGRAIMDYGLLLGTRYGLFRHIGIAASYYYGIPDIGGGIMIGNRSLQVSMSYSL